jgi:hypothetical protein
VASRPPFLASGTSPSTLTRCKDGDGFIIVVDVVLPRYPPKNKKKKKRKQQKKCPSFVLFGSQKYDCKLTSQKLRGKITLPQTTNQMTPFL